MQSTDILIVGAGAAGLMAAFTLATAGKKVMVLEARGRCGGRIHTIDDEIGGVTELGAEFIHGDLPVTIGLLKKAGIEFYAAGGEMWRYRNGRLSRDGLFTQGWDLLTAKLQALEQDIDINTFLEREFQGDEYKELKDGVRRFASGYDSADPDLASSFALRNEWLNEDEGEQYRIKGGYGEMINYLERQFAKAGGTLVLNALISNINRQPDRVVIETSQGTIYEAGKVVIALPLGVLQTAAGKKNAIGFNPPLAEHAEAINRVGFGAVIKILLEFDEPFWLNGPTGVDLSGMSFVLSDEEIPTWWTQAPFQRPLLTGWLGGPAAAAKRNLSGAALLKESLRSLSSIFKVEEEKLYSKLLSSHIVNWTSDPHTLGSYAFDMVESARARVILQNPIADMIYFAGEYLYEGVAMGTVEAALSSGEITAKKILGLIK